MEDDRDIPEPIRTKPNRNEEEIEVELGSSVEDLISNDLAGDSKVIDNDDAGSLFDFDDDL